MDVVIANEVVHTRAVGSFASGIICENHGNVRAFKCGHSFGAVPESGNDSVDSIRDGFIHDDRRQLVRILHVSDLPVSPGVYEIEHAGEAFSSSRVSDRERNYDAFAFHGRIL